MPEYGIIYAILLIDKIVCEEGKMSQKEEQPRQEVVKRDNEGGLMESVNETRQRKEHGYDNLKPDVIRCMKNAPDATCVPLSVTTHLTRSEHLDEDYEENGALDTVVKGDEVIKSETEIKADQIIKADTVVKGDTVIKGEVIDGWTVLHEAVWEGDIGMVKQVLQSTELAGIIDVQTTRDINKMVTTDHNVHLQNSDTMHTVSDDMKTSTETVKSTMTKTKQPEESEIPMKTTTDCHNITIPKGSTAMHLAVILRNNDVLSHLLSTGGSCVIEDSSCHTVLHKAAQTDHVAGLQLLFSQKCDVNRQNSRGDTLLHVAILHGSLETVEYLLDLNADLTIVNQYKKQALHVAIQKKNAQLLERLLQKIAKTNNRKNVKIIDPLRLSVIHDSSESLQILINSGLFSIHDDNHGNREPLLHLAAKLGLNNIVATLLRNGAKVHMCHFKTGKTALAVSMEKYHIDVAATLLSAGSRPNEVSLTSIDAFCILNKCQGHLERQRDLEKVLDLGMKFPRQIYNQKDESQKRIPDEESKSNDESNLCPTTLGIVGERARDPMPLSRLVGNCILQNLRRSNAWMDVKELPIPTILKGYITLGYRC